MSGGLAASCFVAVVQLLSVNKPSPYAYQALICFAISIPFLVMSIYLYPETPEVSFEEIEDSRKKARYIRKQQIFTIYSVILVISVFIAFIGVGRLFSSFDLKLGLLFSFSSIIAVALGITASES